MAYSVGNRPIIPDWNGGRTPVSRVAPTSGNGNGSGGAGTTTITEQNSRNGITTYTMTTRASAASWSAGADTRRISIGVEVDQGTEISFQVSMPEALATPEGMESVDPFDPSTIPVGATVTLDNANYESTEFWAGYQVFSTSGSIQAEEGTRLIVTRVDEDTVRVCSGPISALTTADVTGLDVGVLSIGLGSSTTVNEATLQVAEFDLSEPAGEAAFNDFVVDGELPTSNGGGVSGVQTISRYDTSFQNSISGSVGPLDFAFPGDSSDTSFVAVTNPDGSGTSTATMRSTDDGPVMTVEQAWDADGTELVDQLRYSYSFAVPDSGAALLLNNAMSGQRDGPYEAGDQVTLTFTEEEMAQMLGIATARSAREVDTDQFPLVHLTREGTMPYGQVVTPRQFAFNLIDGKANVHAFLGHLSGISFHAGQIDYPGTNENELVQLPGTVFLATDAETPTTEVNASVVDTATGEVNEVSWELDAEGRPIQAEATLTWEPGSSGRASDRAETAAQRAFREMFIASGSGDHVGHVLAYRFVNGQGQINMFPQNGNFNTGPYVRLENEWADWLALGMEVDIEIELLPAGALRPDQVSVDYRVIDPETGAVVYDPRVVVFDNEAGQVFDRVASGDMPDMIAGAS